MTVLPAAIVSAPRSGPGFTASAARWITAASLAVIITFALFMLMKLLIHVEVIRFPDVREPEVFVLSEAVPETEVIRGQRPELEQVDPLPVTPPIERSRAEAPSEDGFTYSSTPVTPEPEIGPVVGGMALAPSPLSIRIPPVYPARELERGISGQCTIRYDILASGATVNLQVTACDSTGFARASLSAVERWRHQSMEGVDPNRIVNRGVETTLVFNLQD